MRPSALIIALCLAVAASVPALADVPNLMTVQGRLTDAGGVVLPDGDYFIRFRVYNDSLAGSVLWESTKTVAVSGGLFTTALDITDSIFNDPNRWLGITVDTNPEMSPRPRLTSVGYAHRSGQWSSLADNVYRIAGNIGIGTANPLRRFHVYDGLGSFYVARFEGNSPVVSVVEFSNTNSGAVWLYGVAGTTAAVPPGSMFLQRVGTSRVPFTIDVNENVGIGANAPARRLHVFNDSDPYIARFEGSSNVAAVTEFSNIINGTVWQLGVGGPNASVGNGSLYFYREGSAIAPFIIGTNDHISMGGVTPAYFTTLWVETSTDDAIGGITNGAGGTGVKGLSYGAGSWGVYGRGEDYAGYFNGNVRVTGAINPAAVAATVDHPLDPANKSLTHTAVQSPDMKNIYDGVAVTDADGNATVTMPEWFEALNRDFRYQLTVIGKFAQAIVAKEIAGNQFSIKTDKPNVKVSWQVTGIRHDAYADAHRAPVEEVKSQKERGFYIHPELFGQSEEKGVTWAQRPEMMKQAKERREKAKTAAGQSGP